MDLNDLSQGPASSGLTFDTAATAAPDSLYASHRAWEAESASFAADFALQHQQEDPFLSSVNYADGDDPTALHLGHTRDPYQLDLDPFGEKTVRYGEKTGMTADYNSDTVAGLGVFGKELSADTLQKTDAGRRLLEISERNRRGMKRGFLEAVTDFQLSDVPFLSLFASVGGSIKDAVTVSETMEKLQDGAPVTDDELIKTRLYMAEQDYRSNGSWGSTVGDIIRAAPGFMVEFLASGGLYSAARTGLSKAAGEGIHLGLTRATKVLAREATDFYAKEELGKTAVKVGAEAFADIAGDEAKERIVSKVAGQIVSKTMTGNPIYRGLSAEAMQDLAKSRAEYEFSKMLARNAGGAMRNNLNRFSQWLGQNVSRGLMDFGQWGTEESTVLFTNHSKAGRALMDAAGTFFVEAPIRGALLMAPNAYGVSPLVARMAGVDKPVSEAQLSLQRSALQTGNRELMANAESIAQGMNLLEYVSENTGRGLKSLVRAGGLGLEKLGVKGLVKPAESAVLGIVPENQEMAVSFGGKIRQWIGDVFGSREQFMKKAQGEKLNAVTRALGVTDAADRSALNVALMSGSTANLRPELHNAIGGSVEEFADKALRKMYDDGVKDLQYKSYARFAIANYMAKHQIGPETVMNMYERMGYDGILGEMFEERYSDVVKGMLGLDDRAEHDFFSNLKEAVKGIYPGWDQLTAEAVGFAMPMVTRAGVLRLQSAIGGEGKLRQIRTRLEGIEDALRHDSAMTMKYGTYLAAHDALAKEDAAEIANLGEKLNAARTAGNEADDKSLEETIAERTEVSRRREERHQKFVGSLSDAAKADANSIVNVPLLANQVLANDETNAETPTLTSEQAGASLEGQTAIVEYAPELARALYEAEAPLEGEQDSWYRRAAHKIVGLAGAVVSGDMSLAATNPAQWTARDMGLSANVCRALKEGFRQEWKRQANILREAKATAAAMSGEANGSYSLTNAEVTEAVSSAFEARAKQIMGAYLAAHQLRSFSDGRMRDQAIAHVAKAEGYEYTVGDDGSVMFGKVDEAAGKFTEGTEVPASEFYESHRDLVDQTHEKLAIATADILTRRLTKSFDADMRILNMVRLPASSDILDAAIYDAALHMIGGQNLAYVQSIDGNVPLADAIYSSSVGRVNMKVVDYIAGFSSVKDPNLDRRALESVAWSLGLRFDGTEESLAKRDEKIFSMAKLATMLDRGETRHFSRPAADTEDEMRIHSKGSVGLTAKLNDAGKFEVDFGIRQTGNRTERDIRTFDTEEKLTKEMAKLGYLPTRSRILLSQAKTLESTDMFHMIRELDLAPEYLASFGARPRQDRVHPMLRRNSAGKLLSEDEARERLAKELAVAAHWDPSAQLVVGETSLSEKAVRRMWENVWGENGYMRVGERLLSDRGVKTDTMAKYAGEFDAYAPRRYTLNINVGKLSKESADFVVPVDPRVNPDMTSGLVNGVLMRAYASHGRLLRNALNGTVSDFAHEVDAIVENAMEEATAAHDAELVRSLAAFRRSCTMEIDREARTSDGRTVVRRGVGLTPEGFVTLAGAFCAYQAEKYADSPYLRAVAKIAPAVRRAASFMDFTNLVDLTLGGNGFLDAAVENAARTVADANVQTGLRRLVSFANGNADAFRDAVRSSLPGGLGYSAFLDGCIRRMTAMAKSGAPTISEQEKTALRAAAQQAEASHDETMHDHFTFVGQLYGVVKRVVQSGSEVNASTAEFFQKVAEDALAQDAGSTEQQKTALRAAVRDMQKAAFVDAANNEYVQMRTQYEDALHQVDRLRTEVIGLRKKLVAAQKAKNEAKVTESAEAVAEAQTELDEAANALTEKRKELDAAGNTTRSLMKGGRTTGDTTMDEVQDFGSADDVPPLTVAGTPEEPVHELPSAFGVKSKTETRGFWEKYGAASIEGRQFTRSQARLAANVVVRAYLASNSASEGVSESDVISLAKQMFPALVPEEVEDIRTAFRVADNMRMRSNAEWSDFVTSGERWSFSQDEKEEDDTSSDNFNDQALNEYNSESVADFLALAQRTSPETGRNLQGFLRLSREASRLAFDRIEIGFSEDADTNAKAVEATTFLYNLLNPKMNQEGSTQAEHDALHHETLMKFDDADNPASRSIPALLASSEGRPISRRGAFLVAYLSTLPKNARIRFGKLMAHSISASPVHFVKGTKRMSPAFRAAHGKVGENIVTDSFVSLIGKSRAELKEVASNLRMLVDHFRGTKGFMAFTKTADYRAVLNHNAELVAEILATEFGTESPLYTALVSGIAVDAHTGLTDKRVYDLARSVSFLENKKGQKADVDLIESVCATIDALAVSGEGEVTRSEVATAFTATFATGNPTRSSLREAKRTPSISDPLMTFLTTFTDALPVTIMTAEIDQTRDSKGSSVAIAPRDMVPIISRWLYEKTDAKGRLRAKGTSFAEVCAKAFGVTDRETLDRCRQDACWPDEKHTPIVAKNISVSYDNVELREACRRAFEDDPSSPCYWVPIYAGDHSSSVFLQVPRSVRILPNGKFAKAATELKPEDNPTYAGRLGQTGSHVLAATGKYTSKDQAKFNQLGGITRFIGFGPGSTGTYAQDLAKIANTGKYTATDVVGVSVNGRRKDRVSVNSKEYQAELGKAVKAGALIVADTAEHRGTSTYNIGEIELADYLTKHGYLEIEGSGVWAPAKGKDSVTYDDLSKGISKALGLDLMFTDAKRSAISSLEAQGTGMIGAATTVEKDKDGNDIESHKFGENRVHILKTRHSDAFYTQNGIEGDKARRDFDKLCAKAWKGSTFLRGYAAKALKEMVQDPQSSTLKAHIISTQGAELFFGKSLSVATDADHGQFLPGSSERTVMDYLDSFRGSDELSSDLLTDFDSYKIGPANSEAILVEGKPVMEVLFARLEALARAGQKFEKVTGDELDQLVGDLEVQDLVRRKTETKKLSEILPGVVANSVDGFEGDGAIDVSYQENGAMAYTVANVSHKSGIPAEPGRTPRNYEVDALTMATALARGDWFGNNSITLKNVFELVANWGLVANTVYTDPRMQAALRRQSVSMLELERYGENPQGQNMLEELARMVWAKTHEASNLPLVGIDAPLVSSGSYCDDNGKVYCHSKSPMHRAMMQGSEIFTADEAAFFGAPRRMALCNVNVSSNGFRYGWFLDEAKFKTLLQSALVGPAPKEGEKDTRENLWDAIQKEAAGTPGVTSPDHITALAIADVFSRLRSASRAWEKARRSNADDVDDRAKTVAELRHIIADSFKDHHGEYISKKGDAYVSRFGFEDLFMADAKNGGTDDVFDLSAIQFGNDRVANDATGESHVFLGGTMFGLPRTPSYNGSMWLQTVRAGLPVTEVEYEATEEGTGATVKRWRVGRDAMVSPDPTTNAILGCDHDGDKTKLYMLSVEGDGMSRFTPPPTPKTDGAFSADSFANDPSARGDYLAQLSEGQFLQKCVWNEETQREEEVPNGSNPEGWYYKVAEPVRKRVSNEFVRSLFNMSRCLPTEAEAYDEKTKQTKIVSRVSEAGRPRNKFLGGIASSPTKAFPVNDKKSVTKNALPKVLDEEHTIGDPDTAAKASAGALDASNARATIVSLAKSLHLAWATGFFTEPEKNVFNGNVDPNDWFRFMYHVDGLSNATFDDMKEQMCGRLGWTSDMMDTVITELVINAPGNGRLPTTDAEFAAVLSEYSREVKDKGRFHYMLRASRVADEDMLGDMRTTLLDGARFTKSAVAGAFGIEGNGSKENPYTVGATGTVGAVLMKAVETAANEMMPGGGAKVLSAVVRGAATKHGSNPMAGYLYWLVQGFNEGAKASDALGESLDTDAQVNMLSAQPRITDFCEWVLRRSMLMEARSFANSINYLAVDPGDDSANGRRDRVAESFSDMKKYLDDHPVSRDNASIALPDGRMYDLLPALERMHAAARLAYEVGDGLRTVAARAVTASERRFSQTFPEQFKDAAAYGAAKQRVLAKLLLRDSVESWDRMTLESNAQQLPYVCGLFRSMADLSTEVSDTPIADGRTLYRSLRAMAEGERDAFRYLFPKAKFALDPSVLEMRQGVESLFTIMYELMATSKEYNTAGGNKAIAYVRLAADSAYGDVETFDETTGRLDKSLPYGVVGRGLQRLVANFQANDDESISRIRAAFGDIIEGRAFAGTRHHNEAAADRSSAITRTFSVSRETIESFITENLGAQYRDRSDEERLAALQPHVKDLVIKARAALIGLETVLGEGVAVTPSMMFGQLIPAYTVLTSRTLGAPTPQSPSILNLLPGRYYEALSDAETSLNGMDEGLVDLLVSTNWAPKNALRRRRLASLGDKTGRKALAVTNYDNEGYDELASRIAAEVETAADEKDFIPALSGKLAEIHDQWRQGSGVSEGRDNPDFRNSCDIFADDVFGDILDYMEDGWGDGYRRSLPESEPAKAGAEAAGTSVPEPSAMNAKHDPKVAKVALAMSSLLGSWASVEYKGGSTFTIRGRLRGDAGANRNVVITVDASEGPLCDTPEQVTALANSPEYAASLCAAADLGITAVDFMRMAPEIREALVKKYGVGGATANGVAMSVTGRGLATLAGAIRLPAENGTKIYHEYFHAMMRMFDACNLFSDVDRAALAAQFNADGSDVFTAETEENMAEGFRQWVEGNTDATQETRSVFRRIFDFIKGLFEALARGFDYEDESYETIYKMVVHGIAQTSNARRAELLGPGYGELDQAAIAQEVRAKLAKSAYNPNASEAELTDEISGSLGERLAKIGSSVVPVDDIEKMPGAENIDPETKDASDFFHDRLVQLLDPANGPCNIEELREALGNYAALRAEMAESVPALKIGGQENSPSFATSAEDAGDARVADLAGRAQAAQETVEPGSNEARDAEVSAAAHAATFPLVESSDFYRAANMIGTALEQGLRSKGSWQRPLEYIRSRYAAPQWNSAAEESRDRAAILHGLRRALVTLNPEAARKLADKDIQNSLVFEASLHMYHRLESSFLDQTRVDGKTGNVLTNPVGKKHARHASQFQVSAWIMSARPVSATDMVASARAQIRALKNASTSDAAKAELGLHLKMMDRLMDLVGDPTKLMEYRRNQGMRIMDEVIGNLRAGLKDITFDDAGFMNDVLPIDVDDPEAELTPENIHTDNPRSARHLKTFLGSWREFSVQKSLKLALTTAWQVAAMAKYYQELDVIPATAEDIAFQREMMRRHNLPKGVSVAEWMANQAIGDSNLADNAGLVDYANQSYFIANNVDAWLSSLVRKSFGAQDNIGTMMAAENREYGAIKAEIARLENFYSFMFGDNVEDGGEILKLFRQKGELRMEDGAVVRQENGEYVKFDNYNRKTCRLTMTEDDLRTIDLYKKMLAGYANGQRETITGVDRVYFNSTMLQNGADFYSRENVLRRWNDGKPEEEMDALEIACVRLTKQMPESVLGKDGIDLYDRFVNGAIAAMRFAERRIRTTGAQVEPGSTLFNSLALGFMRDAGLIAAHNADGKRWSDGTPVWTKGAVCIGNDAIESLFQKSAAYAKLASEEGGRRPEELDKKAVTEAFMDVYRKAARFAAMHPWLTHGDGRYFNAFGTALPFWRGTGVFMYNAVRSNRNAAEEMLADLPDAERRFVAAASAQDAGTPVSTAPSEDLLPMLDMLADSYGIEMRGTGLRDAIVNGEFSAGSRMSDRIGLVLETSATKGDVARAIYDKLVDTVWDERMNGKASRMGVARAERILSALESGRGQAGELFGGRIGMTDEHVFRKTGCLPANFQIGHKVHAAIDGLTNAMMSRATMINMLLTPAHDGAPVYYADPAQYCAETSGIPDEMWHQIARWWSEYNELGEHGYDPAKSGVQNAHDIFTALHEAGKDGHGKTTIGGKKYTLVSGDDGDIMSVNGWLVREDDQLGDESSRLNALGGGEAMGYLKQFTQAGRTLGFGSPAVRATLHRALSWSKSMSVSFSFFFPLATKWESPIGAVGAMATMCSNMKSVGAWAKANPEIFAGIQKMFGGRGWITKDFLGFQDIMRMMDSNDPFLAELYAWGNALGVTFSDRLVNPMEPTKSVMASDLNRLKELLRREFGSEVAGKFGRIADTMVLRQGDKAFAYALNATKLAVISQLAMKLRYEAQRRGKAFDPIRDLKRYGGYINAEIGGIDPLKYAWAHPMNRAIMNTLMFSWQWTRGAWESGGGGVIEDMLFGGHSVTRQERDYFIGRWARMFGAVMIGVPAMMQCLVMGLAKCLGGGDDDDDRWFTWQNEDKTRWTAFDLTPLLRAIEKFDDTKLGGSLKAFKKQGGPASAAVGAAVGGLLGARGGNWLTGLLGGAAGAGVGSLVPALVPMYTGDDAANQTNRQRRYYMHFGKQGWEFFRWFDNASAQFFSKLSMPTQRILEGIIGRNMSYLDRALPWDDQGQLERWLNPSTDGALFNLAQAFLPFTVGGLTRTGDAGVLPIFGPVQMGASQTNIQDRLEKALTAWAYNDRKGYAFGVRKGKGSTLAHDAVADILADARKNGFDPKEQLDKALGKVMTGAYGRFFKALPEDLTKPFDTKEIDEIARVLDRLGAKRRQVQRSIADHLKKQGRDWKKALTPAERAVIRAVIRGSLADPYRTKTVEPSEYDY